MCSDNNTPFAFASYLFGKEGEQGFFAHHGRVDDFASFQGDGPAQLFFVALFVGEYDGYGSRIGYGNGLFVMESRHFA